MNHRLRRWIDDVAGALAMISALLVLVVALYGLSWLRVRWCVALGGNEATCAAATTISGRR